MGVERKWFKKIHPLCAYNGIDDNYHDNGLIIHTK